MAKTCVMTLSTKIPALKASAERLAEFAVEATAQQAVAHAQVSMAEPKTGRLYTRGKVTHQASAPGESPAMDIGHLANSMRVRRAGRLVRVIEIGAEYAAPLEFGTSRMAARPFLGPALEAVKGFFYRSMREIIRQGAK